MDAQVARLYPTPTVRLPLAGLYLAHDLRARGRAGHPYLYSNFIASLDGRISQFSAATRRRVPPRSTHHPDDWRLYLELAAQSDAVLTSGRRLRELGAQDTPTLQCVADLATGELARWREARGLPPQPACIVLSATADLPVAALRERAHADIVVVVGARAERARIDALQAAGAHVVVTDGARVTGDDVYRLAAERGYLTVYAIAGPEVLYTLVASHRLDRLYLSFALRLIAGRGFDTLLNGDALTPPLSLRLRELYLEQSDAELPDLLLATFDRKSV